jgi:cell division protein FtsB
MSDKIEEIKQEIKQNERWIEAYKGSIAHLKKENRKLKKDLAYLEELNRLRENKNVDGMLGLFR